MKDNSSYITYLPMLLKCVERSTGPILELGMGYSTMILHALCKKDKRKVVSYENDMEWFTQNTIYRADYHDIRPVNDWDEIDIDEKYWSVALVDHRPAKRRRVEAMRLAKYADFILLHDSEPEINRFYGYKTIYPKFKYVYHYTGCLPNTTVLSNFKDLSFLSHYEI